MPSGDVIEFTHADSPVTIPEGQYQGRIVDTDFQLGGNSMQREWITVEVVTDGPLHGKTLTIYRTQQATA